MFRWHYISVYIVFKFKRVNSDSKFLLTDSCVPIKILLSI